MVDNCEDIPTLIEVMILYGILSINFQLTENTFWNRLRSPLHGNRNGDSTGVAGLPGPSMMMTYRHLCTLGDGEVGKKPPRNKEEYRNPYVDVFLGPIVDKATL